MSPTKPAIDPEAVRAFLDERYGGRARDVRECGRGEWSVAYAFDADGGRYVARFGAHVEDFEKDRIAAGLASSELPIPRVLEVGNAPGGGYYCIAERAEGDFLEELGEPAVRATLPALLSTLDAIRRADVSATAGYGPWDANHAAPFATWPDYLLDVANDRASSRIHGWRGALATSSVGKAAFSELFERFASLVDACPDDRSLLHTDLLNRNVFARDGRITAVIDWGNAMYGDYVYELAGITLWQPWYGAWTSVDPAGEALHYFERAGADVHGFRDRLACYEAHVGLTALAYQALRRRWDEFAWTARRTRQVLEAAQAGKR